MLAVNYTNLRDNMKMYMDIGKPEPLSGNLSGYWSRRINDKDRLIYRIDENNIYILACRYHNGDK